MSSNYPNPFSPAQLDAMRRSVQLSPVGQQQKTFSRHCLRLAQALSAVQDANTILMWDGAIDEGEMQRTVDELAARLGTMEAQLQKLVFLCDLPRTVNPMTVLAVARSHAAHEFEEEVRIHSTPAATAERIRNLHE